MPSLLASEGVSWGWCRRWSPQAWLVAADIGHATPKEARLIGSDERRPELGYPATDTVPGCDGCPADCDAGGPAVEQGATKLQQAKDVLVA